MDNTGSDLIFFDGKSYYQMLDIQLISFMNMNPLEAIMASRAAGKKVKPWVPQEENSLYVSPPTNTVFVTNSEKLKQKLGPGFNIVELPTRSLESNLLDLHISWHGKEGTLSVKGRKDTTFEKQTSAEYFDDIVPSIKRDDMATQAVCVLEVIIPLNAKSFQEVSDYESLSRKAIRPKKATGAIKNIPYESEHPSDIIFEGKDFENKLMSVLIFVHMGTRLSPWSLDRVRDGLYTEPITITNTGYKGPVNFTMLVRILDDIDQEKLYPILFSVKSSDLSRQVFFEAIKFGV